MTTEQKTPPTESDLDIMFSDLDDSSSWPSRGPLLNKHQRQMSLGLMTVIFVVVVGVLLVRSADVRLLMTQTFFPSVDQSQNTRFYLSGNPSWGQFTVDGTTIQHFPEPRRRLPLVFTPGEHHITWHIPPFPSRTCTFEVAPVNQVSSPCFTHANVLAATAPDQALQLTFFASLSELLSKNRASLIHEIQATVAPYNAREQVVSGEESATTVSTQCARVGRMPFCAVPATHPEVAHLTVQVNTSERQDDPCVVSLQCILNQQNCQQFCDPWFPGTQTEPGWDVAVSVQQSWSYLTTDGLLLADHQPISAIAGSSADNTLLALHITMIGEQWRVSLLDDRLGGSYNNPFCSQAVEDVTALLRASGVDTTRSSIQWSKTTPARVAQGCLIVFTPDSTASGSTSQPSLSTSAYYLDRFGVVVAVSQSAHLLLPDVSLADGYEQSLSQQIGNASLVPA